MNKIYRNLKILILFIFFKLIFLWTNAVEHVILVLHKWALKELEKVNELAISLLWEEEQKKKIDLFVNNMQKQAKIIGNRPKKDNE